MSILAVDLAAVAWAAFLGHGGISSGEEIRTSEFSCLDADTETAAVRRITSYFCPDAAMEDSPIPEALVIEDLPHGLANARLIKDVSRMQGRIVQQMVLYGAADRLLFVQPAFWQHALGVWRKTPQETAQVAKELGYSPPNLIEREERRFKALKGPERQKVRTRLKKIETDHVDAFLIWAWAVQMKASGELWEPHKAVQRYTR